MLDAELVGRDFELFWQTMLLRGKELQYALERVSLRVIGEQVCDLDSSMGLRESLESNEI